MWAVLAFIWLMPVLMWPWVHADAAGLKDPWLVFYIPRAALVGSIAPFLDWRRGRWTSLERAFVATMFVVLVLHLSPLAIGRTMLWLGGLILVRVARGLRRDEAMTVKKWWWATVPVMVVYWWVQQLAPQYDPWRPVINGGSSYGSVMSFTDQIVPLVFSGPWFLSIIALITLFYTHMRGPLIAAAAVSLTSRRALIIIPIALAVLVYRPPDYSWLVRFEVLYRTAVLALHHPYIGVGTGQYVANVDQNPNGMYGQRVIITEAHNEYFERAAEWGFIGGAIFLAWVSVGAWQSRAIAAMAVAGAFGFLFYHPGTWATFCILYGLATREDKLCVDSSFPSLLSWLRWLHLSRWRSLGRPLPIR